MLTAHHPLAFAGHDGIETRFVLARYPAKDAHALQELIKAFQTDLPTPRKGKFRLRKKVMNALKKPLEAGALRGTLARLGITRVVEAPVE